MSDIFSLFLVFVVVLLPPFAGYLCGLGLPPVRNSLRFPTPREGMALLVVVLFSMLAGRITGGLLSNAYMALIGLALIVWFGAFLPAFAAGVAGRRPFVYGGAASVAFWFWTALFFRRAFVGREWALAPTWTTFIVAEIPFLIALCILGCMPIYRKWRRRQSPILLMESSVE